MKLRNLAALAVAFVLALPLIARAASGFHYTQNTVSVTSTTVPVSVIPSTDLKATWLVKLRSTGANPVLCFHYSGALPGAAPAACSTPAATIDAGCMELTTSQPLRDGSNNYASASNTQYQTAMNDGIACVLSTSGAETVDAIYR